MLIQDYRSARKQSLGWYMHPQYLFVRFCKDLLHLAEQARKSEAGALTVEEKVHYLKTTTDEGSKRLDFEFAH